MIVTTIGMTGTSGLMALMPSTADEMEMAGVMKPSAIRVAQPMSAGIMIHLYFQKREKCKNSALTSVIGIQRKKDVLDRSE